MKKIEKFLFYLFIFSIPFQTRKVLFSTYTVDKFSEWTSGFLYFTDLLLIGIFILWIKRLICWKSDFQHIGKSDFWLFGFFLIAALSLITSQNIGLSIYQLIKLAEFILLFLYIKYNFEFLGINKILNIFVASGVFQALLAIAQFFKQSSLGLKYFEAGVFNANIPGVATFFVEGTKFIRAYGTAPHPNVLAVFLLASIFCLYVLWSATRMTRIYTRMTQIILLFVLMLGLLLTFSRAIILVFIVASPFFFLIMFLKFKKLRSKIIFLFLLFSVFCFLFSVIFWPEFQARFLNTSLEEQAVTLRVYYNNIAVSVIKEKSLFGLGLGMGNFVWYLLNNYQLKEFWLYQPVHNLYLLIASEIGIVGLVFFLIFIGRILSRGFKQILRRKIFFTPLDSGFANLTGFIFYFLFFIFLALAMIDHYFWTIQQSRLLFWLVLSIISGLSFISPRSLTDRT